MATTERIGDLTLERVAPSRPARPVPLLLVHGMWGGAWYLRNYLRLAAAAGWDAWAINLRGHGGSRPVDRLGAVSVLDYVSDVRDTLEALGPAVVLGHSMGGLIAQKAAEAGGVTALVLLTSAAPRGIVVLRWPVLSRIVRYLPALLADRSFLPTFAHARALELNALPEQDRARVYGEFVPESGRAAREMALGAVAVDPRRVRCPVLVMGAEHDVITPPAVERRIAARYDATYLEADGHAHMLMLEAGWERPFERILAWLDGIALPTQPANATSGDRAP